MKKLTVLLLAGVLAGSVLTGCGSKDSDAADGGNKEGASGWDEAGKISVVSREDGSGTRGAFVELFGVEEEKDGEKVDMTTADANITNSTSVMMTQVAGNEYAIGYTSLGALNDTVKAVKIGGVDASAENVKNGSYEISRPFNIAVKEGVSDAAKDFMGFIMSEEGQAIIEEEGYIPVEVEGAYASTGASGKVTVGGSSSVAPVMEKLAEAYKKVNTNVNVEVQQSDSTTGMTSAMDGSYDIGMASRELKDSELEGGLTPTVIALDGIAVIVNNDNTTEDLTKDQVKAIFTGEVSTWEEALEK